MDDPSLPTFGSRYRTLREATSAGRMWAAVVVAAVVAGPFGLLGGLVGTAGVGIGIVLLVVFGPLLEEMVKAGAALFLAERRPWLVPAAWTLVAVTVVSGLVFAVVENVLYLQVYIPDPTPEVIRWRWRFGPLLHGSASLLAGVGVARMWAAMDRSGTPPQWSKAAGWLVAAVLLHGSYNATVLILEITGVIF